MEAKHEETTALLFPVRESKAPTKKRKTSDPLHKTLGIILTNARHYQGTDDAMVSLKTPDWTAPDIVNPLVLGRHLQCIGEGTPQRLWHSSNGLERCPSFCIYFVVI